MATPINNPHYGARISAAFSALFIFIGIGTVGFHNFEHWNWIQSFYFTVATLTTVGYGDLHPTHDSSRLFAAFFILVGVGVALTAVGIIGAAYLEQRTNNIVERRAQDHDIV